MGFSICTKQPLWILFLAYSSFDNYCISFNMCCFMNFMLNYLNWAASSKFGTYRLCEQLRFRSACASAQSRQNLCCSLIQAVSQEEPSDRKPDPGWVCAVKICHDGMLEDTNSLDAPQFAVKKPLVWLLSTTTLKCSADDDVKNWRQNVKETLQAIVTVWSVAGTDQLPRNSPSQRQ